jgi:hypothetical protein
MHYLGLFTALTSAVALVVLALIQGDGTPSSGVSVAQLIAAIAALAGVIGFLWRAAQKSTAASQQLLADQLKKSDERLETDRKAASEERRLMLNQLDAMATVNRTQLEAVATANREAHATEIRELLNRFDRREESQLREDREDARAERQRREGK